MPDRRHEFPWLDILNRKHECGPSYSDPTPIEVIHEGCPLTVLVPNVLNHPERLELRAVVASGEFVVLIGRHTLKDGDDPYERGVLMVARRGDDGRFTVHVWHELYPYALKYLGLTESRVEYHVLES